MTWHYCPFLSLHFEHVRSPHFELNCDDPDTFTDGTYNVLVSAAVCGWPEFAGPWNSSGTAPGQNNYLSAVYSSQAATGESKTFAVTVDPRNGTLLPDIVTNTAGTASDVPPAAIFGFLNPSSATIVNATTMIYDDGSGNVASLVLSDPWTLGDMRANAHELLGSVGFDHAAVNQVVTALYATGANPYTVLKVPTLYTPPSSSLYLWGWGSGGYITGASPSNVYQHVAPSILKSTSGVASLFPATRSRYTQNNFWEMVKSMIVNPGSSPMYFEDDFTATPGPPTESTPQFPVIAVSPMGATIFTPTGTVIDIGANTSQNSYSAERSFLHF